MIDRTIVSIQIKVCDIVIYRGIQCRVIRVIRHFQDGHLVVVFIPCNICEFLSLPSPSIENRFRYNFANIVLDVTQKLRIDDSGHITLDHQVM
jgi:hypothetical protein